MQRNIYTISTYNFLTILNKPVKLLLFFNFFIITNLIHKFLVHSHKLHKKKFVYQVGNNKKVIL